MAVENNYGTRPDIGPLASEGIFLQINKDNEFETISSKESGFYVTGDMRNISYVPSTVGPLFVFGVFGTKSQIFLYQRGN